jgi:hypothetical protein
MKSKVYLKYEEQKELVEKYQLQTDFDTMIHYFTKIENDDSSIIILSLKKCGTILQKWTCNNNSTTIYKKENTEITSVLECDPKNCVNNNNTKCYLCEQKDIEDL